MHQPISDHFLSRYRSLLDAEDEAFDELEHACEEGDRARFDKDMVDWQSALEHKLVVNGRFFVAQLRVERVGPTGGQRNQPRPAPLRLLREGFDEEPA